MGDAAKKIMVSLCQRLLRGELDQHGKDLLDHTLENAGVKSGKPIPWVLCPKCGKPLIRSIFWGVACISSGGNNGCGLKPD